MKYLFLAFVVSLLLTSCLGEKFLQQNEQLLIKQELKGLSGSQGDLAKSLINQKPNTRLFGILPFTHLAHVYKLGERGAFFTKGYDESRIQAQKLAHLAKFDDKIAKAKNTRRERRLRERSAKTSDRYDKKLKEGNQVMRWGEPLAIYDHNKSRRTAKDVEQFLSGRGYFRARTRADTTVRNKKYVSTVINITPGQRSYIDSIEYIIEDTAVYKLIIQGLRKTPLRPGYYLNDNFSNERDHIFDLLVNDGYFEFSKNYVKFQLDSINYGKDTIRIKEIIETPEKGSHQVFELDSIIFFGDAGINSSYERTIQPFGDITYSFSRNIYSRKILNWRIPLHQGMRYSRDLTIETQRQLSFLDNFKFVNINYDTTGRQFIANIFTSPIEKFQTSTEFGLVQVENSNTPGPFFSFNIKNRNAFRGMEVIGLDGNAKIIGLASVSDETDANDFSSQFGGELSISFPQFLFPLPKYYKKKIGRLNPKTRFSIGINYEDRANEYERTQLNTSLAYIWQVRTSLKQTLTPIQVSLIASNNTPDFENFLDEQDSLGSTYSNAFRSAFVSSNSYQLDYTNGLYGSGQDGAFIRYFVEYGYNPQSVLGLETAFGDTLQFYHFFKTSIDLRKIEKVKSRLNLAYRLRIGAAIPFGKNLSLPYEKYFFVGGSNSMRAWRPRRLGPGAFASFLEGGNIDYTREQPGEFIIESSVELRQKLGSFIEGAIFLDAGNNWLLKSSTVDPTTDPEGDDGIFRISNFANELAVGTGVGLRFDLTFLIFRFDVGLKLVDPALPPGERFVGGQIFSSFGSNSQLNIGIGYPF